MQSQSTEIPRVCQYDEDRIAVPVNVEQVTTVDGVMYQYELLLVRKGRDDAATADNMVQAILDRKAQERGYDNILSACTYAISTNPTFAAEGQACVAWRDDVWTKHYSILGKAVKGEISKPTLGELAGMLPKMVWPKAQGRLVLSGSLLTE